MDAPFKKEKKEEIGLDMTPGRMKKGHFTPRSKGLEEFFEPGRSGGRRSSAERPEAGSGEEASPAEPVIKPRPKGQTAPVNRAGTPSLENTAKDGKNREKQKSGKAKKFVYSADRKCIVKIDYRGTHAGSRGCREGGVYSSASARLAPYLRENGGNVTGARVGYIVRETALEGELFTSDGNTLRIYDGSEANRMFGTDPTLTIILSPEDPGADLVELAKRFMKDVYSSHAPAEPCFWCAAVHGNTAHKHVHILVSAVGRDRHSDAVIDPGYVHSGRLQKDTADILTEIQGRRSWSEVMKAERAKKNVLRMTAIDYDMIRMSQRQTDGSSIFILGDLGEKVKKDKASRRLQVLKKAGLVESAGNSDGTWIYKPGAVMKLTRSEFSDYFGLDEEEMKNSVMDYKETPDYDGVILESVRTDHNTMLFMIRDAGGKLHLRRERLQTEGDIERLAGYGNVSIRTIEDGFSRIFEQGEKGPVGRG